MSDDDLEYRPIPPLEESEKITPKELKEVFEYRYQKSKDKNVFLERETKIYKIIIAEKRRFKTNYFEQEIDKRNKLYKDLIKASHNINDYKNILEYSDEDLKEFESFFKGEAKDINEYLSWIKAKQKYPDKYYAWYHKILIHLRKVPDFTSKSRKEISEYATRVYGAKSGFYQAFLDFKFEERVDRDTFVRSLSKRDKSRWKKIILIIANNDLIIKDFLKKFPN